MRTRMTFVAPFAVMALLASYPLAACACDGGCDNASQGEHAPCGAAAQPVAAGNVQPAAPAAGMRVNVDPQTGQYTDRPVPTSARSANAVAAPAPLVETPVPGGGVAVDTRHLQHAMKATANPDGSVTTHCEQSGAAGDTHE